MGTSSPAWAEPGGHMTFRNNLLPGHLTMHQISRTITRKANRRDHVERLRYRQEARWVQCNINEPKPGNVMVYQMMVDHAPKVLSVRHDKKEIEPTPPTSSLVLPKGSTRLHSAYKTPRDGPVQIPMTDPAQCAVLHALLDFAHWPKEQIDAGHRWERDLYANGIAGTQTYEFVDVAEIKGDAVARVTLFVEGKFEEPLAKDYVFGKGQAVLYWSRPERVLVKMEAQADYQRKRANAPEEFKLKLDVGLVELHSLNEQEQERVTEQMIAFSRALGEDREGHKREAYLACNLFRKTWPDSIWMPAVDELEDRVVRRQSETNPFSTKQLDDLLAKTIIQHEAARTNYEYDLLERTHGVLTALADEYRGKLKKIAKGKDAGRRGRAVFVLAFGSQPDDLHLVERAARDKSATVRAMALAGLAARGDRETSAELVIIMLDDEKTSVRRRACQAVAACVSPEHYSVVKAVERLNRLMIYDEDRGVRLEAVRALAAIGAPTDIPKLEKSLTHELDREIREEIHKAIEKLRAEDDD